MHRLKTPAEQQNEVPKNVATTTSSSQPVKYQGHLVKSQGHMGFLCIFCLHNTTAYIPLVVML